MEGADFLEPGWRRAEPNLTRPTFATSRPSQAPGRKPAGLELRSEDAVGRWKPDEQTPSLPVPKGELLDKTPGRRSSGLAEALGSITLLWVGGKV